MCGCNLMDALREHERTYIAKLLTGQHVKGRRVKLLGCSLTIERTYIPKKGFHKLLWRTKTDEQTFIQPIPVSRFRKCWNSKREQGELRNSGTWYFFKYAWISFRWGYGARRWIQSDIFNQTAFGSSTEHNSIQFFCDVPSSKHGEFAAFSSHLQIAKAPWAGAELRLRRQPPSEPWGLCHVRKP